MKTTKVLFYCTKGKPYLCRNYDGEFKLSNKPPVLDSLNGRIVAECEVETEIIVSFCTPTLNTKELLEKSCLTKEQLSEYLNNKCGYALHIKNLILADKPRILRDCFVCFIDENIHAPQNMMRIESFWSNEKGILISIRPEWLCKILNGEKTIEVRKQVLKEML